MSDASLSLSVDESNIYSGACLTYSGVPFHRIEKTRISTADLDRIDNLFDEFLSARKKLRRQTSTKPLEARRTEIELGEADLTLLIEVVTAVLQEHEPSGKDADYALELHVGPRADVKRALAKLHKLQQQMQVA